MLIGLNLRRRGQPKPDRPECAGADGPHLCDRAGGQGAERRAASRSPAGENKATPGRPLRMDVAAAAQGARRIGHSEGAGLQPQALDSAHPLCR